MFTRQAANISQALYLSGLSQASAAAAQNLLGQCRATIEHRGPVRFDYTNPNFQLITPPLAPLAPGGGSGPGPESFPPVDPGPDEDEGGDSPRDGNTPKPPKEPAPTEHKTPQPPPPDGPGEGAPVTWPGTRDYYESHFIRINKRERTISVRANDLKRHSVFPLDLNKGNTIHSVDFFAVNYENEQLVNAEDPNAKITLKVEDKRDDTTWTLKVRNLESIQILTSVELIKNSDDAWQLQFTKRSAHVFAPGPITYETFVMEDVNTLNEATLGSESLDFPATKVWVFKTDEGDDATIPLAECP